mmetsp:Transcript_57277/g.114807  ORF Transcript_57277/g.114807 Transcript_57277/m.114807 type:complete len:703 (-) Transcript_57277:264-2372(-)
MGSRKRDGPCLLPPLVTPVPSSPSLSRVGSAPNLRRSRGRLLGPTSPPGALAASWSCQLPPGSDSEAAAIVCAHLSHVHACLQSPEPEKHERLEQAVKEASGNQYLRTITALRRNRSVSALQRHALEAALASHMVKARTALNDWRPAAQRDAAAKRQPRSGKDTQVNAAEATPKRSAKEPRHASSKRAAPKGDADVQSTAKEGGESLSPDASRSPGDSGAATTDEAKTGGVDNDAASPGGFASVAPPAEELAPSLVTAAGSASEVVEEQAPPERAEASEAAAGPEPEVVEPSSSADALAAVGAEEGPATDAAALPEAVAEAEPAPAQQEPCEEGPDAQASCPSAAPDQGARGRSDDAAPAAAADASDPDPGPPAIPVHQHAGEVDGEGLGGTGAVEVTPEKAVPEARAVAVDAADTAEGTDAVGAPADAARPDSQQPEGVPDVGAAATDETHEVHPGGALEATEGGEGSPAADAEDASPAVPAGSLPEQDGNTTEAAHGTEEREEEQPLAAAAAVEGHEAATRDEAEEPLSPQSPPQSGFEEYSADFPSPGTAGAATPAQAGGAGPSVSFGADLLEPAAEEGEEREKDAGSLRARREDEEEEFEHEPEGAPNLGQRDYTMSFEEDHGGQKALAQRDYTNAFEADPEDAAFEADPEDAEEQDGRGDGYDDFGFEPETPQNQGHGKLVEEEYEDEGDGFEDEEE